MSLSQGTEDFLNACAVKVWERIRFARRRGQRISETTITENLIFDCWLYSRGDGPAIEIYEAKEEKRNGNDLELYVETKNGYLLLACQAKIISKKGNYPGISHQTNGHYQADRLLEYAKDKKGQACYLFYNYIHYFIAKGLAGNYGLSLCTAEWIRNTFFKPRHLGKNRIKIPCFEDIHPEKGIPLAEMVGMISNDILADILHIYDKAGAEVPVKFYTLEEITKTHPWERPVPLAAISGLPAIEPEMEYPEPKTGPGHFNPKYRIIFPKERLRRGLSRLT